MQAPLVRRATLVDDTMATTVLLGAIAFIAVWAIVGMWPGVAPAPLDLWRGNTLLATHQIPRVLGPETFAAAGASTGYQGWLGLWILAALSAFGGGAALGVVCGALFAVAIVLTVARMRGLTGPVLVSLALAAALLGTRPGLVACFNLAALAATVLTLEHFERSPLRYGLVCATLTALWANVDASALFVPGLAALYAVGAAIDARAFSILAKRFGLVALATLAATCITPFGLDLPFRAGAHLAIGLGLSSLVMWQPPAIAPQAYWLVLVPIVVLAAATGLGRRGRSTAMLCTVAAVAVALSNGSYIADAVVILGPVLALRLFPTGITAASGEHFPSPASVDRFAMATSSLALAALLISIVAVFPALTRPAVVAPTLHDAGFSALLDGREHRIACGSLVLCDEIVARGNPNLRVLMDDRVSAYPAAVRHDQVTIATLASGWGKALRTNRIDAVAARKGGYVASILALTPHWKIVAESDNAVLYSLAP